MPTTSPGEFMPTFRTSDGVNLSYIEEGDGHPVVLIHGFTAPAAAWALTTDALVADGYRVIAFDRRSHGDSETAVFGQRMARHGRDIGELLDHLDLNDASAQDAEQPRIAIRFLWLQRNQRRHVLRERRAINRPYGPAVIIEDSGHTVSFDQPDRFTDVLLEFLRTQRETLDR
jgi:pimeloyl-ACP methyl ester carboxylesterase